MVRGEQAVLFELVGIHAVESEEVGPGGVHHRSVTPHLSGPEGHEGTRSQQTHKREEE